MMRRKAPGRSARSARRGGPGGERGATGRSASPHAPMGRNTTMTVDVKDNKDQSRYEISVDGEMVGIADYFITGDSVVFPHTVINPARRGQGLAAQLVQAALDDVRKAGGPGAAR